MGLTYDLEYWFIQTSAAMGKWRGWPTQLSRRRRMATPRCTLLEISSLDTPRWLGHSLDREQRNTWRKSTILSIWQVKPIWRDIPHILKEKGKNNGAKPHYKFGKFLNWPIYKRIFFGSNFCDFFKFCNFVTYDYPLSLNHLCNFSLHWMSVCVLYVCCMYVVPSPCNLFWRSSSVRNVS